MISNSNRPQFPIETVLHFKMLMLNSALYSVFLLSVLQTHDEMSDFETGKGF